MSLKQSSIGVVEASADESGPELFHAFAGPSWSKQLDQTFWWLMSSAHRVSLFHVTKEDPQTILHMRFVPKL